MSALHPAGNSPYGEVAFDGRDNFTRKHSANFFVAVPRQELAKAFLRVSVGLVVHNQPLDRVRHFRSGAAIADGSRNRSNFAQAAADAKVIRVHHFSFGLDLLAFNPDIGNPVLAAAIRATGDMQLDLLVEARKPLLELVAQPARESLRF